MVTLEEIETKVVKKQGKCMDCGNIIQTGTIRSYDHEDDKVISGFTKKQWIFFQCPYYKCRYQSALWKVIQSLALTVS